MTWQTLLPVAKRRRCRSWLLPLLLLLPERTAAALHGTAETCAGWLSDGLESARVVGYAPIRSQPTRMLEIHYFYADNTRIIIASHLQPTRTVTFQPLGYLESNRLWSFSSSLHRPSLLEMPVIRVVIFRFVVGLRQAVQQIHNKSKQRNLSETSNSYRRRTRAMSCLSSVVLQCICTQR